MALSGDGVCEVPPPWPPAADNSCYPHVRGRAGSIPASTLWQTPADNLSGPGTILAVSNTGALPLPVTRQFCRVLD